jgi:hypothetical protein
MRRLIVLISLAVAACVLVSQALTAAVPQLPVSVLFSGPGKLTALKAGLTYQAAKFPVPLRVTPPDNTWAGAQWKSSAHGEHSTKPPFFGWAAVGQGDPRVGPKGLIVITTSYVRTPSVAAVVRNLRTRGHGATYQAVSPVTLAGFSGSQFDGEVVGKEHAFIPFTPKSNIARYYGDANYSAKGELFRIMVVKVRQKTVVVYINSAELMAGDFPAFLTKANQILDLLKFPR